MSDHDAWNAQITASAQTGQARPGRINRYYAHHDRSAASCHGLPGDGCRIHHGSRASAPPRRWSAVCSCQSSFAHVLASGIEGIATAGNVSASVKQGEDAPRGASPFWPLSKWFGIHSANHSKRETHHSVDRAARTRRGSAMAPERFESPFGRRFVNGSDRIGLL